MGGSSELRQSVLRAVLYELMELQKDVDGAEVLQHLMLNVPNHCGETSQRALEVELAGYLAERLERLRPGEASAARIPRELLKNRRLGEILLPGRMKGPHIILLGRTSVAGRMLQGRNECEKFLAK